MLSKEKKKQNTEKTHIFFFVHVSLKIRQNSSVPRADRIVVILRWMEEKRRKKYFLERFKEGFWGVGSDVSQSR